ncbi:MAG: hypothetical protein R3B97_16830 [Dehalococcoidia bacterium]|nr:hypothetical protein [Dehalococcoidia bacterium]MCB9487063.1 hypothetical protein [Thermoflexaceae bacterium]
MTLTAGFATTIAGTASTPADIARPFTPVHGRLQGDDLVVVVETRYCRKLPPRICY